MNENLQIPQDVLAFQDNWTKQHPNELPAYCHNVYEIISEDHDGNITDKAYAVNCMTDYGFSVAYVNHYDYNVYLYIGSGTTKPVSSNKSMEALIGTKAATTITSAASYNHRFYPDTGLFITTKYEIEAYYNYTEFTKDETFTEIGIGSSSTDLTFHALIYDSSGNPTSFVKKMNEKLTIKPYFRYSIKMADIINPAWDKGLYWLISPYVFFGKNYNQMNSYIQLVWSAYHNNQSHSESIGCIANNSRYDSTGTITNNIFTHEFNGLNQKYFIENSNEYISDMVVCASGNMYYDNTIVGLYKPKLSTPVELTTTRAMTNNYDTLNFDKLFGAYSDTYLYRSYGLLPIVDADVKSMYMYNVQTNDWDIEEECVNPTTSNYDIGYLIYTIKIYMYVDFLNDYQYVRVYLNHKNDVPILSFDRSGLPIYATDSYWDPNTWELIPDITHVSTELGTKKYYVTLSTSFPTEWNNNNHPLDHYGSIGYVTIPVTRDQPVHSIISPTETKYIDFGYIEYSYSGNVPYSSSSRAGTYISNDNYGYIAAYSWLVYPESVNPSPSPSYINPSSGDIPYRYPLLTYGNKAINDTPLYNTTRGGKIILGTYNGIRVYTINMDPSIAPTYVDYSLPSNQFTRIDDFIPSHSNNGYFAMSPTSNTSNLNKTYVVTYDVEGVDDKIVEIDNFRYAHIIDLTNYICGVNSAITDHPSLNIYDMSTDEVVDTIDLPAGYSISGICGWKNFIYIRTVNNGATSTYLYYIQEKILVSTTINDASMICNGYAYKRNNQCVVDSNGNVESCMVRLSGFNSVDISAGQCHFLYKESDPENPILLTSSTYTYLQGNIDTKKFQLKYTADNKQLLLTLHADNSSTYDLTYNIGHILNNGPVPQLYMYNTLQSYQYNLIIYKNCIIQFCPHYITTVNSNYRLSSRMYIRPIESFVEHKMTVETRTINSYNNPINVGGVKNFKVQITNNIQ